MFSISRLHQVLQGVDRGQFQRLVDRHGADRYTKGFGCWQLLVAQVYGQLSQSRSLRELEAGINAHPHQHYHLHSKTLSRTTLADACARRSPAVFEELANQLMASASRSLRRIAGQGLLLLDSTSFTLKGRGFEWSEQSRTRNTQGLKLHVLYDQRTATPVVQQITAANVNDISEGRRIALQAGATYVFDKGYCDYTWWSQIAEQGARFITRLKRNARFTRVHRRRIPADAKALIASDETVRLSNPNPGGGRRNPCTMLLRRITVRRDGKQDMVLITNDLRRTAVQVAHCYKARWQIELFFKWLKQHLRIKQFYGRSENAVRIQILCALITLLLVALYARLHAADTSLLRVLDVLRAGVFQRPSGDAASLRRQQRRQAEHQRVQPSLFP